VIALTQAMTVAMSRHLSTVCKRRARPCCLFSKRRCAWISGHRSVLNSLSFDILQKRVRGLNLHKRQKVTKSDTRARGPRRGSLASVRE
jgi:hypothetical protein